METGKLRWLGAGLLAGTSAGLLAATATLGAAPALAEDTALVMGYVFTPEPGATYLPEVTNLFLNPAKPAFPGQPVFPGYTPVIQPANQSNFGPALTEGVSQLDQGITAHLADGGNVVVFAYSSSSAIATQEMINLAALPAGQQPDPADLRFVIVEDLNSPNGGIFTRFPFSPGLSLPATPADTPYTTDIYNIEYSGATDFPQYPLNLLALANSMAGFTYLHPFLLPYYPTTFNPAELAGAVAEPTSPGYDGDTHYFMIPTQNLPLLDMVRIWPFIGPVLADLIQPDLRVLIDLGYDRTGDADVTTPMSLSLPNIDWDAVSANLVLGAKQGVTAAMVDLGLLAKSELPDLYPYLPDLPGLMAGTAGPDIAPAAADAADPTLFNLFG